MIGLVSLLIVLGGCLVLDPFGRPPRPMSPWQEYRDALQAGDLGRTSAVRAWLAAGGRAVAAAPAIAAPYREIVYFDPLQPTAGAWRLALNEREELRVQVAGPANGTARLFLDLLRWERREWRSVATLQQGSKLRYRVGEAGTHVLRIQPELPSGGRWTVTVVAGPRLIFPVEGADSGAIGGRFGDSRDDGRRSHEGVDIFAPRGTRALAAADGWVSRINRTRLGGRVAWVETDDGLRLYYAHLKSWKVRAGERVRAGDVIGRVGSTGNAKRRSPHLHFGVYDDGPVDPLAFLLQPAGRPAEVTSDLALLGGWARVGADHVSLHAGPSAGSPVRGGAFRHEALHVDGATADWYRVRTADGPVYVASRLLEGTDTPIRRLLLESRRALRREPAPAAPIVAEVEAHASLEVLAEREEYLLVRRAAGERPAWLAIR